MLTARCGKILNRVCKWGRKWGAVGVAKHMPGGEMDGAPFSVLLRFKGPEPPSYGSV